MRTFYLITNCSGMTYWSYLGTRANTCGSHRKMVDKYGPIYINRHGGWFPRDCAETIVKIVKQSDWPDDPA